MTDVLIYWRDYKKNATGRYAGWHSNSQLLGKLLPGDRMWMVTSGKGLGHEAEQAGFLVAVWQVAEAIENPDDDPELPTREVPLPHYSRRSTFHYTHRAGPGGSRPATGASKQGIVHWAIPARTTKDHRPDHAAPTGCGWSSTGTSLVERKTMSTLTPWRQVVQPHADIRLGKFDSSVFAADLGEVMAGRGAVDYRDACTFFSKTYLTQGLPNCSSKRWSGWRAAARRSR